ncbi:MAG: tetratricopeptide repeat protein, partial [Prosthecobacter sp.]
MAFSNGGAGAQDVASVWLAEIWLREGQPQKVLEHLIKMLDMSVRSDCWEQAFDLLHRAWSAMPEPREIPKAVLRWVGQGSQGQQVPQPSELHLEATSEFRGHAELIIARWLRSSKRPLEAAGLLEGFIRLHPAHPRLSEALRMAMQIYSDLGVEIRVMELVEQWRSSFSGQQGCTLVDFLAGGIQFRHAEFLAAEESFQAAANVATTPPERRRSLFNAAVSALRGGELVLYLGLLAQLEAAGSSQDSSGDAAADLQLNKALEAAARQSDDADEELRHFISMRPSHPRVHEARMALVQLLLLNSPPLIDEAKRQFSEIRLLDENPAAKDKVAQLMAYTRLWMQEISGDPKGLIAECEAFVKAWPQSPLLPEVIMKEAGAHFQLEDFASARTSFEIVAKEHARSSHADTALYFAALSAMSVMSAEGRERALEIWGGLAKKRGPLAIASLRQQALAYRRQADLPAALNALDQILSMGALDEDKRNLTICEKAEVLLLQGKKNRSCLEEAAKLLRIFLDQSNKLSFLWKARAGFTLATVLHEAGSDAEALESCYDTLRAADIEPPSNPTDYLWFSKAGFFGIELLEDAH